MRAYHFYDASEDATAQAQFFLAALVDGLVGVALDLERGDGDMSGPALAFLGYVAKEWHPKTLGALDLYTNLDFISRFCESGKANLAALCGLWLAYPADAPPAVPAPWARLDCWQNDWYGSVPGVVGDVDTDVMLSN